MNAPESKSTKHGCDAASVDLTIVLVGCSAGLPLAEGKNVAQYLHQQMGIRVIAPDRYVFWYLEGKITIFGQQAPSAAQLAQSPKLKAVENFSHPGKWITHWE